jgi:hypothetical protein
MKLLSDSGRILLFLLILFPRGSFGQEGTWSFSVFGGISAPRLNAVNETLDKTVNDWNERQIPISSIGHFSSAPSFGFRGSYRYDRDISASLSGSFSKQSLNASYRDTAVYLSLDRSIQTTDIMLGLAYHLPPLLYDMEVSIVMDVGLLFAKAEAVSYNTHNEKSGSTTVTVIDYDSDAVYRKTKLIATAGAVWTWGIFQPFFLKAEGSYRFGNMGKMDGEIRRLQGSIQEQTVTDFDFSGFSATVGIGIFF